MNNKLKYVDLTYLESMAEGNEELIVEMIGIFKKQVPQFVAEMDMYLERKDWQSLGAVAHKAKSSVYIMGMSTLADDLKTLETIAKKGTEPESYASYIMKFKDTCDLAIGELDGLYK